MGLKDYAACLFTGLFMAVLLWLCVTAVIGILWLFHVIGHIDPLGWPMGVSLAIGFVVVIAIVSFERDLIGL